MGKWIGLVVTAALLYVGGYAVASFKMTDRFATFHREMKGSCKTRGSGPDEAQALAGIRAAAERAGVEYLDGLVRIEPLTKENAHKAGVAMEAAVGQAAAMTGRYKDAPGGKLPTKSFGLLVSMDVTIATSQWLWSDERTMNGVCVNH